MNRYVPMVIACCVSGAAISAQPQPAASVEGVWKVTAISVAGKRNGAPQPGLYIFSKRHYSIVQVTGDAPRPVLGNPQAATAQQLLATYGEAFHANAGSYELAGGLITTRPIVSKSPAVMRPGYFQAYSYKLSGKKLVLTTDRVPSGPAKEPVTYELERVE